MRIALLADVHGNGEALAAVLAEIDRAGVDRLVCAGDLVGYGPEPNECVRTLLEREAVSVLGNHDLMVLERMGLQRCVPDGRRAVRWTRRVLAPDVRGALGELPLVIGVGSEVVVCHGMLDDPDEYTNSVPAAQRQLALLGERHPAARLLVCGHTHRAFFAGGAGGGPVTTGGTRRLEGTGPWLVNPGAVGQSRDAQALARYAVVDLERGEVEFRAISYDVAGCAAKIFAAGLSTRLAAPPLSPAARLRRFAGRAARRLRLR